ncbi:MAG: prepilin-type N-terminal cleavage/methylation domain-containing protein, partial [Verrucomicrobiae bacterium]|nr:prepilin-type N-terminal cleavage/methylation domain-containing protein [Verrucomicrobiae bacterium]
MPGKWGFTLLELMTVVTIMLILMGLSFMAFQQLNSAGNVSAAASELSNFVMQARQHAITYGTPVRVGIAMDTNNGAAPLQTYAAYARNIIVLNETTGAATTNWSSISGARFLPRGVFFDYDFPAKS